MGLTSRRRRRLQTVPEVLSVAGLLLKHVLVAHGPAPAGPAATDAAVDVVGLGRNSAKRCLVIMFCI